MYLLIPPSNAYTAAAPLIQESLHNRHEEWLVTGEGSGATDIPILILDGARDERETPTLFEDLVAEIEAKIAELDSTRLSPPTIVESISGSPETDQAARPVARKAEPATPVGKKSDTKAYTPDERNSESGREVPQADASRELFA